MNIELIRQFDQEQEKTRFDREDARRTMTADQLALFEERTGYTYHNGQMIPLKTTESASPQFFTDPVTGERFYQSGSGVRQVRPASESTRPMGVAVSAMVGSLTQGIEDIDNKVAEIAGSGGMHGKRGPNWLPGRTRQ